MTLRAALLLLAAALAPSASALTAAPAAKPDWTRVVTATPQGGFRMGNPAAAVTLIEYGSLACPHCRHFEETGYKPLVQTYVRSGRVSYEFRSLLISGPDISITMLTRCAGAGKFFAMSQYVFATQPQWLKKLEDMSAADISALDKLTDQQRVVRYAQIAKMGPIAARFGVTPARARQCLADPKGLKRLLDMTQAAMAAGVKQTPTFIVSGKATDASTWEGLEPELKSALGERG
ncbi:MAG TPA: thioredoxin domain-containing protein [Sphingomicrobium sp.]|nr:thioredoxin domain-containing protein [Sphingomicrobium sp.]